MVAGWGEVDREDYPLAMERSPVRDFEIRLLPERAPTDKVDDQLVYMKPIDAGTYSTSADIAPSVIKHRSRYSPSTDQLLLFPPTKRSTKKQG